MTKREKLIKVYKKMKADSALPLRNESTKLVFGEGNVETEILFIGEGPGYWENEKGLPFVGRSGAFLNQLLTSIGLERKDVFITNIVHHRPPENRDPFPEEILAYKPYLDEIIETIKPKIIVTLGRFSMAKFLPGVKISDVHGKKYTVSQNGHTFIVVPMYHPAAGLRSSSLKESMANDFKKLPAIIKTMKEEIPISKSKVKSVQMNLL